MHTARPSPYADDTGGHDKQPLRVVAAKAAKSRSHSTIPYLRPGIIERLGLLRVVIVSAALGVSVTLAGCDWEGVGNQPTQAQPSATITTIPFASQTANSPDVAPASPVVTPARTQSSGTPAGETTYTVQEGDTLSAIAVRFDTTVDALMQANSLASADIIYIGQILEIVPTGAVQGAATLTEVPQQNPIQITRTPTALSELIRPTEPIQTTAAPTPATPAAKPTPVVVNGRTYDAYNQAVIKKGQWYQYTCEFDAAWVVLKTYGYDVGLDKQVEIVGQDKSIEPYFKDTPNGIVIYGGDVTTAYSGDYKKNFLARSSGQAMRKVFEYYGLRVTPVHDQPSLEAALLRGELVWIKTTVDFKSWREATWIMEDGRSYKTVLGNDHALVVMGFNKDGVVVRDPLGPTSTNWQRKYEYDVPWSRFMASWGAQEFDGLAVTPSN